MCLWKEKRYSMQKTLLQTIHGPLFSQRGLLSLQPRLCLCLLAYKSVDLFPTDFYFFFPSTFQNLARLWCIFISLQADSHRPNLIRAIKICKTPSILHVTMCWDFTGLIRHLFSRSGDVFLERQSWFVGSSYFEDGWLMVWVLWYWNL